MKGTAEPGYRIDVDVERRLVTLTLVGFWDQALFDRYTHEVEILAANGAKAGRPRTEYRVLIDLREHGLQSQSVAAQIQMGLIENETRTRRQAVLVSRSALHKAQAQRLGRSMDARFFENEHEAISWLLVE